MVAPLPVSFIGGSSGEWLVRSMRTLVGAPLPPVQAVQVTEGSLLAGAAAGWVLRGVVSNDRYLRTAERDALVASQPALGRPEARCARLIPIRKTAAWWSLPQEERREVLEASSRHIAIGLEYLPAVARRLHHSRDLGEPFDFLTWFEFDPADADAFDELVVRLRATPEWRFVDREIELVLEWAP
jgi:chlorite dismutase